MKAYPFLAIAGTFLSLVSVRSALLAAEASANPPWYNTLSLGVTRAEIERLSGGLTRRDNVDVWDAQQGHIEFQFRGDVLLRADHRSPPGGGLSADLYATHGDPAATNLEARRDYLRAGKYADVPRFTGTVIRTAKYVDASCYEVDGQYLVVEALIPLSASSGHLRGKSARVLLVDSHGTERILYRADEHWRDLRPPGVSNAQVAQREARLRQLGPAAMGRSLGEVLGPEDSRMGSGMDYRIYYLPIGIAIVNVGAREGEQVWTGPPPEFIRSIYIRYPGKSQRWVPFTEWLVGSGTAQPGK